MTRSGPPTSPLLRLVDPAPRAADALVLDNDQCRVSEHRHGVGHVVGPAGSGKTTSLLEWVASRVEQGCAPDTVLVLTHSRQAARRNRIQLQRRLGGTGPAPEVTTVHSLAWGVLRRHGPDGPAPHLLTAPEQEFRVRELLAGDDPAHWPASLGAALTSADLARDVRALMARARQWGMDPPQLEQLARHGRMDAWASAARFFQQYLEVLGFENAIDYAELVHRARLLLTDPPVREAVHRATAGGLVVDEFQDLDPAQASLVADLLAPGGVALVASDPDGSVNRFRGADPVDAMRLLERMAAPSPVRRLTLTHSHRHGQAIGAGLTRVASNLPWLAGTGFGDAGAIRRPELAAHADAVEWLVTDDAVCEAEHVADTLRRAHVHGGVPWGAMAVIARHGGRTLPGMARALAAHGVPSQIVGSDIALAEEPAVRPLLRALAVCAGFLPLDASCANELLASPLAGVDAMGVRQLGRQLRDAAAETAERRMTASDLVVRALTEPTSALPAGGTAHGDALRGLAQSLDRGKKQVAEGASAHEVLWGLWAGTTWPERLREAALRGGPSARGAHRDLDAVCALFALAARKETGGNRGVADLLADVGDRGIRADEDATAGPREGVVSLLTAHRAKGREWDLVAVVGLQEGVWPDLRRRDSLLDPDRLTPSGLTPPEPLGIRVAEERRLFLTACSRARRRLVVTSVPADGAETAEPSRFCGELGVEPRRLHGLPPAPLTLPGLVATLRRTAADAAADPALRVAAGGRLGRLAAARDDAGRPLAPLADPSAWWGLRDMMELDPGAGPGPITLSGSSLDQLLRCPRKWFCERRVRADIRRPAATALGSVIHLLAEHAAREQWGMPELRQHLDAAWEGLTFEAPWLAAHERSEAEAALERFLVWQQRHNDRRLLAVEARFEVELTLASGTPIRLVGAVDRLEQQPHGALVIVDIKTGRQVPSVRAAATMPQLGVYQLAAAEGAFEHLTSTRVVAEAQAVYLRQSEGRTLGPAIRTQPPLEGAEAAPEPGTGPTWVHDQLEEAARIITAHEFPARACGDCRTCPFAGSCPATPRGRHLT